MSRWLSFPVLALLLLGFGSGFLFIRQLPAGTLALQPMSAAQVTETLVGGDFRLFWAQGRLASQGQAEQAYLAEAIAAQAPVGAMREHITVRPSLYPPFTLLLLEPLGRLDFPKAWLVYSWGSLLALALVVLLIVPRQTWLIVLALGFGPVWVALGFGQNTLYLTALYLLLMSLSARHAIPAGMALGLAAFKPHLGVLAPLMLLLRRQFAVFAVATLTLIALIALSWLRYGEIAWLAYRDVFMAPIDRLAAFDNVSGSQMVSLYAGLRQLGLDFLPAATGQGLLAFVALVCLWRLCRKAHEAWLPVAALATAALLVMPHLYSYDLVLMLVPLLALVRWCQRYGWSTADICIFIAAYAVPGFASALHYQLNVPVMPALLLILLVRLVMLSEQHEEHED